MHSIEDDTRKPEATCIYRNRCQEALAVSETRFRRLFEAAQDGILILDAKTGQITEVNPFLISMLGYSHHEFLGKKLWEVGAFKDIAASKRSFFELQKREYVRYEDLPLETKHGKKIEVEFVSNIYTVDTEKVIQCNIRDITDRKIAEVELRHHRDHLQEEITLEQGKVQYAQRQLVQAEKMATIGQLAAGVAHEINNPTGYVINNLEILRENVALIVKALEIYRKLEDSLSSEGRARHRELLTELDEIRERNALERVLVDLSNNVAESYEGALRIKKIVSDLRSFAHTDEGRKEEADLNGLINSALNIVWAVIKYKVEVKKEFAELPAVKCFPQLMSQVFVNLIMNAGDAIEERGKITLRSYCTDNMVCAEVEDTGCGLSEEIRQHIFEPFFTTKSVGKGTGLGLTLVYNIIEKHGGHIDVRSSPGSGTTFIIRLPLLIE